MILNKYRLMLAVLLFLTWNTQAQEPPSMPDCPPVERSIESRRIHLQCLDQALEGVRRDVMAWQNKTRMHLQHLKETTGNTQLLPIFERAEKLFADYTESQCRWQYLELMPDVTKSAITFKRCEYRLLNNHLETLKRNY